MPMFAIRVSILLACGALLLVQACGKQEAPPAAPPAEVTVLRIEPRDVPVTYEFIAQTQSPQEVNIVARVNGFLDKQSYTEGALVKEGQVLFQMDQKPFVAQLNDAQAGWDKAKAAHDTALANLNRVKPLAAQNALSKKDLDDATGSEQSSAAALAQAKAQVDTAKLNLSYTVIASPLNGVSGAARQKVGAYLSPANSQLTTVSSLHPMWVNFSVSENEFKSYRDEVAKGLIAPPKDGKFVVEIIQIDGAAFPHKGQITFVDPSFNPQTGTFLLRVTVPNPGSELRPNQYVRVRVKGATRPGAILVPQRAVQQGAKGHFVWVVSPAGKAELRPVAVGEWQGEGWIIRQGLAAGDQVAVDGTLRLGPGALVKATPYALKPGVAESVPLTPSPGASLVVFFDKRKATLDEEALRLLKGFAPPIRQGRNAIDVTGYADGSGSRKANLAIAEQRAAAVRDALVAEGIAPDRIRLQPPRVAAAAGHERNARRVELSVGR
ncbi:MAG: efflux RND transporter periplasmic adaptor subunit [Burkholderiales bacterium]|nr:efflux RND transporter periplasmic adaptor subunit [Burkholderiales bacterium]